ncbi:MAG: hypothetical protein ABR567_01855 [Myxococcales bacterium]
MPIVALVVVASLGVSKPWQLEYYRVGGIAGYDDRLTVNDDGRMIVPERRPPRPSMPANELIPALPAEMAALTRELANIDLAKIPPDRPRDPSDGQIRDALYQAVEITSGGRTHKMREGPLLELLASMYQRVADERRGAKAGAFPVGNVWSVEELTGESGEGGWRGTWMRRGDSNVFDAVWTHSLTGSERFGTVQLDFAARGRIQLHVAPDGPRYDGSYDANVQSISGSVSDCGPCRFKKNACTHCIWRARVKR